VTFENPKIIHYSTNLHIKHFIVIELNMPRDGEKKDRLVAIEEEQNGRQFNA